MSMIPDARALLQRVREGATPGPWAVRDASPAHPEQFAVVKPHDAPEPRIEFVTRYSTGFKADASLIVLLAGNPALLDAIDYMFYLEYDRQLTSFAPVMRDRQVERIASALVQQGTAMGIAQDVAEVEP